MSGVPISQLPAAPAFEGNELVPIAILGVITNITKAASAVVTINNVSASNPFTVGGVVSFENVTGMTQINTLIAAISSIGGTSGAWTVTLPINTTGFSNYATGGLMTETVAATVAQFTSSGVYFLRTSVEIALGITPSVYGVNEGNIIRYGASTGAADNSAAINKALSVSDGGGNAAFIPGGTWNYTSTLNALAGSSMFGTGVGSILQSNGCDGITFAAQGAYAGSRFFRDFQLLGSSATSSTYNGIVCNLGTGTVNARITGVEFVNLTIKNYLRGVYENGPYGMWNCTFVDCFLYNNYHGYYLNGQAVYFTIRGGLAQVGAITGGSGSRYGFYSAASGGGNGQSLHFSNAYFYGYDYNMSFTNPFYVNIDGCDLSVYNVAGIFVAGYQGTFTVRDTWIQSASGLQNHAAVYIADLGTQLYDKIVLDGCTFFGSNGNGSCAVYGGHFAGPMTITNSTFGDAANNSGWPFCIGGNTPGTLGTSAVGSGGFYNDGATIFGNTFYSTVGYGVYLYSSVANVSVGPNVTQLGIPVGFTSGTPTNFKYIPSGATAGTVTFSGTTATVTLGYTLPNNLYRVTIGGNAAGNTWVSTKTTSTFVLTCASSNTNTVDWQISYG